MQVSLAQTGGRKSASDAKPAPAERLLASGGARIVLGARHLPGQAVEPIAAAADTLFGPRGACLAAPGGPLLVCDTGHHRLLIWRAVPEADNAAADCVIGQPDFRSEGRNAKGDIDGTTLNVPTGIAVGSGVVAVADAWNHRILIWQGVPDGSHRPADVVLGQADFRSGLANRGGAEARADTLSWCYGVSIHDGWLIVADTGNRRVLAWNGIPTVNGTPADLVLGQIDFTTRDDGAGGDASALGMRWPHAIAVARGRVLVADAGTNRVMIWNALPDRNGVPCDAVLGQPDATGIDHNRAAYHPTAATMSMPYGVALLAHRIIVADTANSRLLGFDADRLETGASAIALAGQQGFEEKGDNRWGSPARDSVCWPYGVATCDSTLVVADSGNNRVLLWETG